MQTTIRATTLLIHRHSVAHKVGTPQWRLKKPLSCFFSNTVTPADEDIVETKINSENGICHVILNRPDKLNALNLAMFEAIAKTASNLRNEKSIRAVILSGNGRAFCTGLDVKSIVKSNPRAALNRLLERPSGYGNNLQSDDNENIAVGNLAQDVSYLWRDLPVPVIAVLHGMCYGGGLQIALGADIRYATHDCKLSIMEGKWGLIPDMAGSIMLRELVRIDVAKELTMTGKIINGDEAASVGLVTRCYDDPFNYAEEIALELVQRSPDAVASAKRMFQQTWVAPEKFCLEKETELQRKLLPSWNQMVASGRAFGINVPYSSRKDEDK